MLKELEALRNKQKKHDEEMEDLRRAHQETLEVPQPAKDFEREEEDQRYSSGRKASTIEEFTVSELIAQLQKQGKRVKLVDADGDVEPPQEKGMNLTASMVDS